MERPGVRSILSFDADFDQWPAMRREGHVKVTTCSHLGRKNHEAGRDLPSKR
jgi:hypothetical protein